MADQNLKRTPLHDVHVALGAKMVPFGGFEMPVTYPAGITAEHKAVRENVGVFDVSHMGEFEVTGPDRNAFVQRVTCNDVGALKPGQAQYSGVLTNQGTFVDDCLVYRFDDKLMLVVNASNLKKDWDTIVDQKGGANVRLRDISDETALLAVQGPKAEALLAPLTNVAVGMIPYYEFTYGNDIDDTITPLEAGLNFIVRLDKGAPFMGEGALKRQKLEGIRRKLVGFK